MWHRFAEVRVRWLARFKWHHLFRQRGATYFIAIIAICFLMLCFTRWNLIHPIHLNTSYPIKYKDIQPDLANASTDSIVINEPTLCTERFPDLQTLSVVISAPDNYDRRMHIRDTWGHPRHYRFAKIAIIFAMGMSNTDEGQEALLSESRTHKDIIQGKFLDAYRNLTFKSILMIRWSNAYCSNAQFVLKVDDDILVNIFNLRVHLIYLLATLVEQRQKDVYICSIIKQSPVNRNDQSPWFVSKEDYQADYYRNYCAGFAYIMTRELVAQLEKRTHNTKWFPIEDVYVTLLLARKLNVIYRDIRKYFVYSDLGEERTNCLVEGKCMFSVVWSVEKRTEIWNQILQAHLYDGD